MRDVVTHDRLDSSRLVQLKWSMDFTGRQQQSAVKTIMDFIKPPGTDMRTDRKGGGWTDRRTTRERERERKREKEREGEKERERERVTGGGGGGGGRDRAFLCLYR